MAGPLVRMHRLDAASVSATSNLRHPFLTHHAARRSNLPLRHISTFPSVALSSRSVTMPAISFVPNAGNAPATRESSEWNVASHLSAFTLFGILWDTFGLLLRLPRMVKNFFEQEEEILNEIEEEVDEAADMVKIGAKIVGKIAKEIEKIAEVVEKDAEEVEDYMDNVKVTAKTVHKEVDEVVGDLKGFSKVKVKIGKFKETSSSSTALQEKKTIEVEKDGQEVEDYIENVKVTAKTVHKEVDEVVGDLKGLSQVKAKVGEFKETSSTSTALQQKETIGVQVSSSSTSASAAARSRSTTLALSSKLSDWYSWGKWLSFPFLCNTKMNMVMSKALLLALVTLVALNVPAELMNSQSVQGFLLSL